MGYNVLVTGGAGFIGYELVDSLRRQGHNVRVLDNLWSQVHPTEQLPSYFDPEGVEFIKGDIRDENIVRRALQGIDFVFHEAAAVGVADSMKKILHYYDVNVVGTANLVDLMVNEPKCRPEGGILVASSMSLYGEGLYHCNDCEKDVEPGKRTPEQMQRKQWEMICLDCGEEMRPLPIPETLRPHAASVYAATKRDQEEMVLMVGETYGIPSMAFRYWNTYGPNQSQANPYTGVPAIFLGKVRTGNNPLLFEDGLQRRDFVSVTDVTGANLIGMEKLAARDESAMHQAFNVGSGEIQTVEGIARIIIDIAERRGIVTKGTIVPELADMSRVGDIRHGYPDLTKIKQVLGFEPQVTFQAGMEDLIESSAHMEAADHSGKMLKELEQVVK